MGVIAREPITVDGILHDAKKLFPRGPWLARTVQHLRPYICPFHLLVPVVPPDSAVLDVGCGSGLFLGLLLKRAGIRHAVGFDYSPTAIALAESLRQTLPDDYRDRLSFQCRDANAEWPEGSFDVVSMIDVMHHVPPAAQQAAFAKAVSRVAPGGVLLYKDMADAPAALAFANRMHDLVMARQWINYAPIETIKAWGREAGLVIEQDMTCRMLWYAHEWVVFRKPA